MTAKREHIFISYAWEDAALAEWLSRKLMIEGYAVWIDRFKLLGGDIWPDDIDDAIKNRSFRMVHLLSKHSLSKPNPKKERQIALKICAERNEKFLIPLKIDNSELDWQLTDIQYIRFEKWADGFYELLKSLEEGGCPKPWQENGKSLAIRTYTPNQILLDEPEQLITNCYQVIKVPSKIYTFVPKKPFRRKSTGWISFKEWPNYWIDELQVLAFEPPPDKLKKEFGFSESQSCYWKIHWSINGVPTKNIIKFLIRSSFSCSMKNTNLEWYQKKYYWYFPKNAVDAESKIKYTNHKGKRTFIKAIGNRQIRNKNYKYFLAFSMRLRDDITDHFTFQIKTELHLTDIKNNPIDRNRIQGIRKAITRSYFNHEWLSRQEAIMSHISNKEDQFTWGSKTDEEVIFSAKPISFESPKSINEKLLDYLELNNKLPSRSTATTLDDNEQGEE